MPEGKPDMSRKLGTSGRGSPKPQAHVAALLTGVRGATEMGPGVPDTVSEWAVELSVLPCMAH